MAITITKQPTQPNMANNDLLFVVSSNKTSEPQYQYVLDVFDSGSSTLIQRIKQQPNPNGLGVFNMGNILTTQMDSDNTWKTQYFATSSESNKLFDIKFGEQFASSSTSTPALYDGIQTTTTGSPALSGSDFYVITDGLVDYPDAVAYNFNSASYWIQENTSDANTFSHNVALSTAPKTQYIREGDYLTIGAYEGNMDVLDNAVGQDLFYVKIQWKNASGAVIQNNDFYNIISNNGVLRTNITDLWSSVYTNQDETTRLLYIGLGYQNLVDAGITPPSGWASYTTNITGQGDDGLENGSAVWDEFTFVKQEGDCEYNGVRFAWKNEFGVWDYYNFTLQSNASNNIERISFKQSFVPYNTNFNVPAYDKQRRGTKQIVNKVNRVRTANSDWLTQAEADWLRELFFSTNVYIQDGSEFLPCVINDAVLNEKTNPRTQKVFQYAINFELANNKRNRR